MAARRLVGVAFLLGWCGSAVAAPGRTAVCLLAAECLASAQLAADVFDSAAVRQQFPDLTFARADADPVAADVLRERHRVAVLPTVLVLDDDGRETGRVEGYVDRATFVAALDAVCAGTAPATEALWAQTSATPDDGRSFVALGVRLDREGDPAAADWAFERAAHLDPTGHAGSAAAAYERRGQTALRVDHDYGAAVAILAEGLFMIAGQPEVARLLPLFATALLLQGDEDGATRALNRYTAAHPYDPVPFLLRARFFVAHGLEPETALRDTGVVLSLNPPLEVAAHAYYLRARLHLAARRVESAHEALAQALELAPETALYAHLRHEFPDAP